MIVEDEALIAKDIEFQLTCSGYDVVGTSATALEAFACIERAAPDLVLMDISLKGDMDGIDTANIVCNRYALPVIYLTANTDPETVERARLTGPFGYIVKPIRNSGMIPVIAMALNRHRNERELKNQREMLSTILQGLPDAVLVADPSGETLFLNPAAEQLCGWTQHEAAGKSLSEVIQIENDEGRSISAELVQQALLERAKVRVPRHSTLVTRGGHSVEITGQMAVTCDAQRRPVGFFVSLQEISAQQSAQQNEEKRRSQEHQMQVAGELAHGVAQEFYALCNLIDDCAQKTSSTNSSRETDLIQEATQLGKHMSVELMQVREWRGSSQSINVGQYLLDSHSMLECFCGVPVTIHASSESESGFVLSAGNHFEQLLTHLCIHSRHALRGQGQVTICANSFVQAVTPLRTRSYVRIAFLAEDPQATSDFIEETTKSSFEGNFQGVNMTIVRALALAAEGFCRVSQNAAAGCLVEVFLPRHVSRESTGAGAKERSRIVLLAGVPRHSLEAIKRTAGENVAILEAATLEEAGLISELYPGHIELIVVADTAAAPGKQAHLLERIRSRRPSAAFMLERDISKLLPNLATGAVA